MKENRQHVRVKPQADRPVAVQIVGDGFIELLRAVDISIGGVGVFVSHNFEGIDTNSEVQIIVKLPAEKPFMTRGVIRHITKRDGQIGFFGVEFQKIAKPELDRVQAYVTKRLAEGGGC